MKVNIFKKCVKLKESQTNKHPPQENFKGPMETLSQLLILKNVKPTTQLNEKYSNYPYKLYLSLQVVSILPYLFFLSKYIHAHTHSHTPPPII